MIFVVLVDPQNVADVSAYIGNQDVVLIYFGSIEFGVGQAA